MEKTKTILLDNHGVLVDMVSGFRAFLMAQGIGAHHREPERYNMVGWCDLDPEATRSQVMDFITRSDSGFEDLPPYPGALGALQDLRAAGYRIDVLSAVFEDDGVREGQRRLIDRHFGDLIDSVTFSDLSKPKSDYLGEFTPSIWVEDQVANARMGLDFGHAPQVIRHPYNVSEEPENLDLSWHDDFRSLAKDLVHDVNASPEI